MFLPDGIWGAGIYDCKESKCPSLNPYYCILGVCKSNQRDCQLIEIGFILDDDR